MNPCEILVDPCDVLVDLCEIFGGALKPETYSQHPSVVQAVFVMFG